MKPDIGSMGTAQLHGRECSVRLKKIHKCGRIGNFDYVLDGKRTTAILAISEVNFDSKEA